MSLKIRMNTVGKIIESNRLSKNLTIKKISKELKISIDILENIENDEINKNYNIVFYIGHLRSYCNFLKLDSDELVNKFKEQVAYKKNDVIQSIAKPNFDNKIFFTPKVFHPILILCIFVSFYMLFVKDNEHSLEYAIIPDLPESYIPVIEEATLNDLNENLVIEEAPNIKESFSFTVANASNKKEQIKNDTDITLKILNTTWLQLRDESNNIVISQLMNKGDEYTYNMSLGYQVTAGNGGNIMVILDSIVRGKIGKYGEVVDSIVLDYNFNN
mgnify:CR=1 FL=1